MTDVVTVAELFFRRPPARNLKTLSAPDNAPTPQCEKFFLAVADVPGARGRAEGLWYQANFDERVKEAYGRIKLFSAAIDQVRERRRIQTAPKYVCAPSRSV
jgi:hypothetical protein